MTISQKLFPASDPIGTGPRTERDTVETNDSSLEWVCWIRNSDSASLSIISPFAWPAPGERIAMPSLALVIRIERDAHGN